MAQPPASPPSSDIGGVDRDAPRSRARGKPAEPGQQEELEAVRANNSARPNYETDITPPENAR